jgi:hypothetical protein
MHPAYEKSVTLHPEGGVKLNGPVGCQSSLVQKADKR